MTWMMLRELIETIVLSLVIFLLIRFSGLQVAARGALPLWVRRASGRRRHRCAGAQCRAWDPCRFPLAARSRRL